MELEIRTKQDDKVCTLVLEGEVDVYTAPRLKEELVSLISAGCTHLIVDLEKVAFIDSSGLGVLVSALRRAREKDGAVRIVCTRESILKIFRITGLDKVFPIFSDAARPRSSSRPRRPAPPNSSGTAIACCNTCARLRKGRAVFGITGFKLIIILVAGLILIGPDKMPEIARTIGKAVRMFNAAKDEMQSMIRADMFASREPRVFVDREDRHHRDDPRSDRRFNALRRHRRRGGGRGVAAPADAVLDAYAHRSSEDAVPQPPG